MVETRCDTKAFDPECVGSTGYANGAKTDRPARKRLDGPEHSIRSNGKESA